MYHFYHKHHRVTEVILDGFMLEFEMLDGTKIKYMKWYIKCDDEEKSCIGRMVDM